MAAEAGLPAEGANSKFVTGIKLEPKEANGAFDIGA